MLPASSLVSSLSLAAPPLSLFHSLFLPCSRERERESKRERERESPSHSLSLSFLLFFSLFLSLSFSLSLSRGNQPAVSRAKPARAATAPASLQRRRWLVRERDRGEASRSLGSWSRTFRRRRQAHLDRLCLQRVPRLGRDASAALCRLLRRWTCASLSLLLAASESKESRRRHIRSLPSHHLLVEGADKSFPGGRPGRLTKPNTLYPMRLAEKAQVPIDRTRAMLGK